MDIHELLPDGESTAKWAIHEPGFLGTVRQLLCCARCGDYIRTGRNEPRHYSGIFTPAAHAICNDCYEALPE